MAESYEEYILRLIEQARKVQERLASNLGPLQAPDVQPVEYASDKQDVPAERETPSVETKDAETDESPSARPVEVQMVEDESGSIVGSVSAPRLPNVEPPDRRSVPDTKGTLPAASQTKDSENALPERRDTPSPGVVEPKPSYVPTPGIPTPTRSYISDDNAVPITTTVPYQPMAVEVSAAEARQLEAERGDAVDVGDSGRWERGTVTIDENGLVRRLPTRRRIPDDERTLQGRGEWETYDGGVLEVGRPVDYGDGGANVARRPVDRMDQSAAGKVDKISSELQRLKDGVLKLERELNALRDVKNEVERIKNALNQFSAIGE